MSYARAKRVFRGITKVGVKSGFLLLFSLFLYPASAQEQTTLSPPAGQSDSTVVYPADFFSQWNPVTVADMIDRIPGTAIALDDSPRGQNNRGLGSAENILINGRRLSGKGNSAAAQLSRISFDQVMHIEIIRGTSSDLVGVRNEGQIINIVTDSNSETSVTVETTTHRYQDSHVESGGSLILNGTTNALNYRASIEARPEYQILETRENSLNGAGDFSPNDMRKVSEVIDQTNLVFNSNLSYEFFPGRSITVNLLYEDTDPPRKLERAITDLNVLPPVTLREAETIAAARDNWEVGIDYNHSFEDGSRLQLLAINNRQDEETLRQRFLLDRFGASHFQDLSLRNDVVTTEDILRAVYTKPLRPSHDVEIGIERAETVLDTNLELAQLRPAADGSPPVLTPINIPNANSEIEEIRHEGFVVHHWQINPRMKLESTLLLEISEINQTGDVKKSRDFDFFRPKFDFRYDITPTTQLRLSVEKFIAQLRFADFAAATDPRDEERDTLAGNPELRQEESWRSTVNMEYRFLQGRGVFNARAFYWDVDNAMGRIDVSPLTGPLVSVNGNIGKGQVIGLQLNTSYRITPDLLVSGSVLARHSEVRDPFTGRDRRLPPNDRGNYRLGIRHDLPSLNFNYGLDYLGASQGNRPLFDIDRIDDIDQREDFSIFVEKTSITRLGLAARFEVQNILDSSECSDRLRFDGRLSDGIIKEIEKRCTERGTQYVFQLRATF